MEVALSSDGNTDEVCVEINMSAEDAAAFMAQASSNMQSSSSVTKTTPKTKPAAANSNKDVQADQNNTSKHMASASAEVKGKSTVNKSAKGATVTKLGKKNKKVPSKNPVVRGVGLSKPKTGKCDLETPTDNAAVEGPAKTESLDNDSKFTNEEVSSTTGNTGFSESIDEDDGLIPELPVTTTGPRKSPRKSPIQFRPTDDYMIEEPDFVVETNSEQTAHKSPKLNKKAKMLMVKKIDTAKKGKKEKGKGKDVSEEKVEVDPKPTEPLSTLIQSKSSKQAEAALKKEETKEGIKKKEKASKNPAPVEEKETPTSDKEECPMQPVLLPVKKEDRKRKQPPAVKQRGGKQAKTTGLRDKVIDDEKAMETEGVKAEEEEKEKEELIKSNTEAESPILKSAAIEEKPICAICKMRTPKQVLRKRSSSVRVLPEKEDAMAQENVKLREEKDILAENIAEAGSSKLLEPKGPVTDKTTCALCKKKLFKPATRTRHGPLPVLPDKGVDAESDMETDSVNEVEKKEDLESDTDTKCAVAESSQPTVSKKTSLKRQVKAIPKKPPTAKAKVGPATKSEKNAKPKTTSQKTSERQKMEPKTTGENPTTTNANDGNVPEGWRREAIQRKSGKTAGKFDIYYYSPDGQKHRSRNDVRRYLEDNPCPVIKVDHFDYSSSNNSVQQVATSSTVAGPKREKKGGKEKIKITSVKKETPEADKKTVAETSAAKKGPASLKVKLFPPAKRNSK